MKKLILSLVLAALMLTLAAPAYASAVRDGQIILGEDFTLASGETINGDLVVLGGSVTLEAGARVDGDVVVVGGRADIAGQVDQNVTITGGRLTLRSSAVVDGQLTLLDTAITREEGAQVKGGESLGGGNQFNWGDGWSFDAGPNNPEAGWLDNFRPLSLLARAVEAGVAVLLVSLLALVIALLWPDQTTRASAAIATAPAVSGLLGLLTLVAVPILLGLLALTLCLAPVSLLGFGFYVAAILFGWVAFGALLGNRLSAAFRWNLPPAGTATLGTLFFTSIAAPLWFFPGFNCLGVPLDIIFACIGLGGVVLTRFGMAPYLYGAAPRPPMPPMPPAPAPDAPPAADDVTLFAGAPEPPLPAAPPEASERSPEPPEPSA